LEKSHITICEIFSSRSTNLKLIQNIWLKGDIKKTLETLSTLKDPAVVVDILNNLFIEKTDIFTLDICTLLLPILNNLLLSKYQEYILISLKIIRQLLCYFKSIKNNILNEINEKDERMEKYHYCLQVFKEIKKQIDVLKNPSNFLVEKLVKEIIFFFKELSWY
jgi:katanin p80 WD40 repeat-containing subunit B1